MLDNVKSFLVRSRNTNHIFTREEYEAAIALALEAVAQLKIENERLEVNKKAQAQTIKAAHIRTAEVSTRYNNCQKELEKVNENTN